MTVCLKGRAALLLILLALVFSGFLPSISAAMQGGPDAFGYSFIDSHEVDGPKYVWEDIEKTGIVYKDGDNYINTHTGKLDKTLPNSVGVAIPIGFKFKFYGKDYSWVRLAGNGYITFARASQDHNRNWVYDGNQMPSAVEPNNIIAPFWGWNDTWA